MACTLERLMGDCILCVLVTSWSPAALDENPKLPKKVTTFGYIVYNSCLQSAFYTEKKKNLSPFVVKNTLCESGHRVNNTQEFSGNDLVLWVCQPPPTYPWQMSTLQRIYLSFGDQTRSFSMALLKPQLMAHITVFFQLQENGARNREHQFSGVAVILFCFCFKKIALCFKFCCSNFYICYKLQCKYFTLYPFTRVS